MPILMENLSYLISCELANVSLWSKDLQGRYIASNQQFARFFGFKNGNETIGISDHNLRSSAADLAETFQSEDKQITDNQGTGKFFEILQSAEKDMRILLTTKVPLITSSSNQTIGTFGHALDITNSFSKLGAMLINPYPTRYNQKLSITSFEIGQSQKPIHLSQRQSECLFFLLRHKTIKQIALILNLSVRTIETYIEQLKLAFDCPNKSALLEKAMVLGFFYTIPESIFNTQLSIALETC